MACAPSEDSDQPGHPPSLISLLSMENFKVHSGPISFNVAYPLSNNAYICCPALLLGTTVS